MFANRVAYLHPPNVILNAASAIAHFQGTAIGEPNELGPWLRINFSHRVVLVLSAFVGYEEQVGVLLDRDPLLLRPARSLLMNAELRLNPILVVDGFDFDESVIGRTLACRARYND